MTKKSTIESVYKLQSYASAGDVAGVSRMIKQFKVHPNSTSKGGCTALIQAAKCGQLEVVVFLVEKAKADIGTKDKDGDALYHALRRNHIHVAQYLVQDAGAHIDEAR
jgi:ankyrin repeat protein